MLRQIIRLARRFVWADGLPEEPDFWQMRFVWVKTSDLHKQGWRTGFRLTFKFNQMLFFFLPKNTLRSFLMTNVWINYFAWIELKNTTAITSIAGGNIISSVICAPIVWGQSSRPLHGRHCAPCICRRRLFAHLLKSDVLWDNII